MADKELKPFAPLSQGIEQMAVYEALEFEPFLCGYGNTMMFRRDLLHLCARSSRPPADGRVLAHDTWIYTLAAALGRVSHLEESLILYRRDGSNVSQLDNRSRFQRLVDLATFDVRRHSDRVRFNGEMADIFTSIAATEPDWRERAQTAADRYRQRQAAVQLRLDLFAGPRLADRWRSFQTLESKRWAEPISFKKKAFGSSKDFLLGVLATGKRRH
jgi:hypothetical protein